jgi:hypothetical protein
MSNEKGNNTNSPNKKCTGLDRVTAEFYQTFTELTPMILKLFHKVERKRMLQNSFFVARITLIPKPDKNTTKRKTIDLSP